MIWHDWKVDRVFYSRRKKNIKIHLKSIYGPFFIFFS